MSWERDYYTVTCKSCGNIGMLVTASDDWNRVETSWQGFKNGHAYPTNPLNSMATCEKCDSQEILITQKTD